MKKLLSGIRTVVLSFLCNVIYSMIALHTMNKKTLHPLIYHHHNHKWYFRFFFFSPQNKCSYMIGCMSRNKLCLSYILHAAVPYSDLFWWWEPNSAHRFILTPFSFNLWFEKTKTITKKNKNICVLLSLSLFLCISSPSFLLPPIYIFFSYF